MMNSNPTSTKPLPQVKQVGEAEMYHGTILAGLIALLGFLGFLDASYLTAKHYFTLPLPCSLTQGCDTVLTSAYSTVAGIPVAFFGALYYLTILFCAVYLLTAENPRRLIVRFIFILTSAGILLSLVFLYLQIFVIHALCMYCLGSATSTLLLFILSFFLQRSMRMKANNS